MRVPVGCSVAEIRAAVSPTLSERGLKVTTVHLDHSQAAGNRVPALVRLQPPTLPWKRPKGAAVAEADGGASASATSVAERALRALSEAKVALRGERAILQAGYRQCVPPCPALTWPRHSSMRRAAKLLSDAAAASSPRLIRFARAVRPRCRADTAVR